MEQLPSGDLIERLLAEMAELRAQLKEQQSRLARLQGQESVPVANTLQPATGFTTSRRRLLAKLAGALVAGVAATAATGGLTAQARLIADPAAASGNVGAIIVPRGIPTPGGTLPGLSTEKYGLVATDGFNGFGNTKDAVLVAPKFIYGATKTAPCSRRELIITVLFNYLVARPVRLTL